ncbi:NAD(P)H-dependent flavin oxidoreductase [Chelatococcus reniformis]|uniref:2-nitropropane dioxygenase n=1 Tax=Chelatococcus reniformis TaxID=1494448 RepID=A0A916XJI6_9HYPH|nr:nitronate monooxygenase family protein [Chelatococcus reniformis]GGC78118.1 2-nitropropane dioxygenase [Chelatococcus reniformis]
MALPKLLEGRLSLPLIASPLFIVSGPELVIAQCKAGIVGSFPALNARPADQLDVWIRRIKEELAAYAAANPGKPVAPFAVNQIAHKSNVRLMADVEVCLKHEVPIIITSLRAPRQVVEAVHAYGGIVLHDVINIRHARKAIEDGVDGLITVCAGAGGHAGTLSPFALVRELRTFYTGTIALSGAIADGASLLAALAMGADMGYMGTRFIATAEANAKPEYKQMLINSTCSDVVYSAFFSGVHGNYLAGSISQAGLDPFDLPPGKRETMDFSSGDSPEAKLWKDIWACGQGIGAIDDAPPVAELVERLRHEFADAKRRLSAIAA